MAELFTDLRVLRALTNLWRLEATIRRGAENARWSGDPEPAIYLAGVVYGALHALDADRTGYSIVDWLIQEGVGADGAHHKQWYLERLAEALHVGLPDHISGVAPTHDPAPAKRWRHHPHASGDHDCIAMGCPGTNEDAAWALCEWLAGRVTDLREQERQLYGRIEELETGYADVLKDNSRLRDLAGSDRVEAASLLRAAVEIDGVHHKQYYLQQIAEALGVELPDHIPGVAP